MRNNIIIIILFMLEKLFRTKIRLALVVGVCMWALMYENGMRQASETRARYGEPTTKLSTRVQVLDLQRTALHWIARSAEVLTGRPTIQTLRALYSTVVAWRQPSDLLANVTKQTFELASGASITLITPKRRNKMTRVGIVYIHGGGWVLFDSEFYMTTLVTLATRSGVPVVSVNYRLAPEHPYPAAHDDAVAAYRWTVEHAANLGFDSDKIAVIGDSAGGNLAASVVLATLSHKTKTLPVPSSTVLIYPALSLDMYSRSQLAYAHELMLSREHLSNCWAAYLGTTQPQKNAKDPLCVPATTPSVKGFPPALIITAERDVLRDEGVRFSRRLRNDNPSSTVQLAQFEGKYHGFAFVEIGLSPVVDQMWQDIADFALRHN